MAFVCGNKEIRGGQVPDMENQRLLEQIRREVEAIGDGIRDKATRQQVERAIKQAEENISRLLSNCGNTMAAAPASPAEMTVIDCPEVVRLGGRVKRGNVERWELEGDVEIRVSLRSTKVLGSTEVFTIRNVEPGDYHLILAAIPRSKSVSG